MMLTGDYHQTAIAAARGAGMLPSKSQLIIIQARSELQSTAQPPRYAPSTLDSSHSLRPPAYPVVGTFNGSGKSDGQQAGSSQVSGSKVAGSMGSRHASFTQMSGTTTADNAVSYDPVSPFGAAQERPSLQKSSQQHSRHQLTSQEQSCQQVLSQQQSLHKQSYQVKLSQQQSLHKQSHQVKLSRVGSSVHPLTVGTAQTVSSQQDTVQVVDSLQRSSCENLIFMLQSEDDEEEIDAQHAITSLAQVQCPLHTMSDATLPCIPHVIHAPLLLCMSVLPTTCLPDFNAFVLHCSTTCHTCYALQHVAAPCDLMAVPHYSTAATDRAPRQYMHAAFTGQSHRYVS